MINFPQPDATMVELTEKMGLVLHVLLFLIFPLTLGGTLIGTLRQTFLRREVSNDEYARWRHILFYLTGTLATLLAFSIVLGLATQSGLLLYMGEPLAPFVLTALLGLLLLTVNPIFTGGRRRTRYRTLRMWLMLSGLLLLAGGYIGAQAWRAHPVGAHFDIDALAYRVDSYGAILTHPTAWMRGFQFLLTSALSGMVLLSMLSPSRPGGGRIVIALLIIVGCGGMDYLLLQNEREERPYAAYSIEGNEGYHMEAYRTIVDRRDTARKTILDPVNFRNGKQFMNLETMRRSKAHYERHRDTMGYAAYLNPADYLPAEEELFYASRIHFYALLVVLLLTLINGYERSRTGIGLTTGLLATMTVTGSLLWLYFRADSPWVIHEQFTQVSLAQWHYYTPMMYVGRVLMAFYLVLFLFFLIYLKQQRNYTQK
jgi:cytochrome bd-type quinol oxidase subunit 1